MRKLSVYALSAATALAMAGTLPISAQAAMGSYQLPGGNGKVVVIGGNNMGDLKNLLGQIGNGQFSGNCGQGLPDFDGWPDNNRPTPDHTPDNTPDQPEDNSSMDQFASRVVELVNAERAKAGLSPLTVDNSVASAAATRAKEIEKSFSHSRPDGSSFSTALKASGVSFMGAGENIAYGQQTPEAVMQGWMNSSGHRANILNPKFTTIGVGHYQNAAGVHYWTQLFTY